MVQSYAVIGTGAIGGHVAMRLHLAGFSVHCLLHSDYEVAKQNGGLTLVTENNKTIVPVNIYFDIDHMPKCDVILVALKTTANSLLADTLPKIMHDKSVIVLLQNGIGMESQVAKFINPEKIMGGSCRLKVTKIAPGVIRDFGFNDIEVAQYYIDEKQIGVSKSVELLTNNLAKAGFKTTAKESLTTMRWEKIASNIALSGVSVVLNAHIQDLVNNESSFKLLCMITREVVAVAKGCGADITDDFYAFRLKILEAHRNVPLTNSSMKDDFDAGRQLELQAIYANTLDIAKRHGVSMPLTEMLYLQLMYLTSDVKN